MATGAALAREDALEDPLASGTAWAATSSGVVEPVYMVPYTHGVHVVCPVYIQTLCTIPDLLLETLLMA